MSSWKDMLDLSYSELDKEVFSALLDSSLDATDIGKPVKVSANNTVAECAAEDPFVGILDHVDSSGDIGTVQHGGPITVPYTGAPGLNRQELVANGAGGVKPPTTAGTGRMYFILNKDTTENTVTFLLC